MPQKTRPGLKTVLALAVPMLPVVCLALAVVVLQSRRPRPKPYDPADARHLIDALPSAKWLYEDEQVTLRGDVSCWSAADSGRMELPKGEFTFHYRFAPEGADPLVFERKSSTATFPDRSISPDFRWPLGNYDITGSETLPSGQVVQGGFVRHIQVRRRELRLTLTSDKARYRRGEVIELRGSVQNVCGKDLSFRDCGPPEIRLGDGNDWMVVEDVVLPTMLRQDEVSQLFVLQFVAGRWDKRFKMGRRTEDFLPPFEGRAEYTMTLTMKVPTGEDVQGANDWLARPWMGALPATTRIEILPAEKAGAAPLAPLAPPPA